MEANPTDNSRQEASQAKKTLGKWYVIVAVLVFTFCVSVFGHTPAGWVMSGVQYVVGHAPRLGNVDTASIGR
jgi:uncharacterized ion transporter superfamily protein YfcC